MRKWQKKTTKQVAFEDVPIGSEFAYSNRGHISLKINVFTKIEPLTESAPNAISEHSSKLKLWFKPYARVRVLLTQEELAALSA